MKCIAGRSLSLPLVLCLVVTALGTGAFAQKEQSLEWSSQRGDLGRRGHSGEELDATQLEQSWIWTGKQPPSPAWPGPARWDAFARLAGLKSMRNYDPVFHVSSEGGRVYFGSSSDDAVHCLDAATGEERWLFRSGGPVRVAPTVVGELLYFGSDDGAAYCLKKESGELVWKFEAVSGARRILSHGRLISGWPVRTGVHVMDGVAYFGASLLPWRSSYLCAVDALEGVVQSSEPAGSHYVRDLGTGWTLEGAMLLSEQSLILPQGRIAPLVFERQSGEPQGMLEGGGGSFCLLTGDDQVLHGPGNKDGWITASMADSREKLASFSRGNAIVVGGKTAYMLSDRSLSALDLRTQTLLWHRPVDTPFEVILAGSTLFCGGDGKVEARSALTGELSWRGLVEGRAWGLAVAGGRLFVSTDRGSVHGFEAGMSSSERPLEVVEIDEPMELGPPPPVMAPTLPGALLDRWVFQSDQLRETTLAVDDPRTAPAFVNAGSGRDLRPRGRARLAQAGGLHALVLDGLGGDLEVASDFAEVAHPVEAISVEAWARVDQAQTWGGLISMAQDNGSYERGWMLGFRDRRFGFALATEDGTGRLTWLLTPDEFQPGSWHQVVGTYDGEVMRLFVDGFEAASTDVESGAIAYPAEAYYHIGAYRDADEYFRIKGLLAELSVHEDVLSPEQVLSSWKARAELLPRLIEPSETETSEPELVEELQFSRAPSLRFVSPGRALVTWETDEEQPCRLEVTPQGLETYEVEVESAGRSHSAWLANLRDRTVHDCVVSTDGGARRSRTFECDTHFDFFAQREAGDWQSLPDDPLTDVLLEGWLEQSPVERGLVVVLGCGGTEAELRRLAACARQMEGLIVLTSDEEIGEYREQLARLGPYGARISVVEVPPVGQLALPPNFANLMIVNPDAREEAADLMARGALDLVRPDGGTIFSSQAQVPAALEGFAGWQALEAPRDPWFMATREALPGAGAWTHMYGRPDNSAFGGEQLAGASDTSALELSWIGRPGPRYQTDRQNRKPAPLSTAGRLFLQGLNRVLAVDGHNGTLLWDVGLPGLQRFNIPRSSSNWCADRDTLYLAMGGRLHRLEADTGEERDTIDVHLPRLLEERLPPGAWEWGYVAQDGDLFFGSAVRAGGQFTDWWGGENWFDAKSGEKAKKVCSEALFALTKDDGPNGRPDLLWSRSVGRIVEPTIAISEGRVVFTECRNPAAMALDSARVGSELWKDLWLVALDARTGDLLWEREARPLPGNVAIYLALGEGTVVLMTSGHHPDPTSGALVGEYAVYAFDLADGKSRWRKKFAWEADHHGKHLSRPAIVGGNLIVRPMVFELADGAEVSRVFPVGHQCGSYACSSNAIFLRAGDMTVWDRASGEATRWARLRPDCWISTIPAAGMLLSPEGGGGCSCGSWIQASMGFAPKVVR